MPRPISGEHEAGRIRTEEYRDGLEERREPETAVIDTALASSLAQYLRACMDTGTLEGLQVVDSLQQRAVKQLVGRGLDKDVSVRRVATRLYFLQMLLKHPNASNRDKKRWQLGPVPVGMDPLDQPPELDVDDLVDIDDALNDYDGYSHGDNDDVEIFE